MIRAEFQEVTILQGDGNLWWTGAINLGVQYALDHGAEYVMTLNNDTVVSENFVEKMLVWAKLEPRALLGALAIDARSQMLIYGGEIIDWRLASYKAVLDTLRENDQIGLHEVTHFPGRGLLIPSGVFRRIGLFDGKLFPHYAADYDFTHRAIRAGYRVFCNYDAKLYVYPKASGDADLRNKKSIRNYYNHLFGIKGGGNLKIFCRYASKNCPRKYLLPFLLLGILRRVFGYPFEWVSEAFKLIGI